VIAIRGATASVRILGAIAFAMAIAGCGPSAQEQNAAQAEAAALRAEQSAAHAERTADKAAAAAQAASDAADRAAKAVKEASDEIDRVGRHIDEMIRQRELRLHRRASSTPTPPTR
jgi:hypothetical protein